MASLADEIDREFVRGMFLDGPAPEPATLAALDGIRAEMLARGMSSHTFPSMLRRELALKGNAWFRYEPAFNASHHITGTNMQVSSTLSFLHLISYDGRPGHVLGLRLAPGASDDAVQVPKHSMGTSIPYEPPAKAKTPFTSRWYWGEKSLEYFASRGLQLIQKHVPHAR